MPAGLVLAWLFSTGTKLAAKGGGEGESGGLGREIWYGLPFVYLGICALACLMALLFVRPPPRRCCCPEQAPIVIASRICIRAGQR